MSEKLVYVPRNWKVTYVDLLGNEHENVELCVNAEYRIIEDGVPYNISVAGIRTENDKTFIVAKIIMQAGFMNVMDKSDRRFDLSKVTEITRISTKYVKTVRSMRDRNKTDNVFTFAFDSEKYPSKYRISVYAGEFVALALKDPNDSNKKSRSIYGHVVDVDATNNEIKFMRYVSNRGVRDAYIYTVALPSLLGIYRYELEINDYAEKDAVEAEVAATTENE